MQFLLALLEHPVILLMLLMFFMGFVGMTYEFILRMCGKKPFLETPTKDEGGSEEPPEPANVPKPPTDPDDELEGAEEIPDGAEEIVDEDGNTTVQYTYSTDFDQWWKSLPKEERNQKKDNIDLMEPEGAR